MNHTRVRRIAGLGLLTAIVILLQLLGSFIRFGTFSVSLVLLPIVIGAALYGVFGGAWLGFVFGMTVLIVGDAGVFMAVNVFGTLLTVLLKGTAAGAVSGLIFRALAQRHITLASVLAAIACPMINTGIFLAACPLFFYDTIMQWARAGGASVSFAGYVIFGLAGMNFLVELGVNIVLIPILLRLIRAFAK